MGGQLPLKHTLEHFLRLPLQCVLQRMATECEKSPVATIRWKLKQDSAPVFNLTVTMKNSIEPAAL